MQARPAALRTPPAQRLTGSDAAGVGAAAPLPGPFAAAPASASPFASVPPPPQLPCVGAVQSGALVPAGALAPAPAPGVVATPAEVDRALVEAHDAYQQGNYARAIQLCQSVSVGGAGRKGHGVRACFVWHAVAAGLLPARSWAGPLQPCS